MHPAMLPFGQTCPARPRSRRGRQAGFSLVEVIAVLVVVALLFTLVGGSVYRNLDSVKIRRVSNDIVAAMRYTRGQAIVTHEEQFLEIDIERRSFKAADRATQELPEGVDITLRTAAMDILDETRGRVRFYPDGSSTGGTVTLMAGDRVWRVQVAWLTGEITRESSVEGRL